MSTSTQNTQSFKFRSKISFFQETQQPTKIIKHYKEELKNILDYLQERATLIPISKPNQTILYIQTYYKIGYKSTFCDETKDHFENLIEEIKLNIFKKYPFISIIHEKLKQHTQHDIHIQFQQQNDNQLVLYSKQYSKEQLTPKLICDLIWISLHKFNLTINLDCINKYIQSLKEDQNSQNNILDGIKITIRQKESNQIEKNSTPKRSTQNLHSIFNSMSKTETHKPQDTQIKSYYSPIKSQNIINQNVIRLFSQTQIVNSNNQAQFNDLISNINYEVEVTGNQIQSVKQVLNLQQIYQENQDNANVSITLNRSDLIKCIIKAPEDSTVNVFINNYNSKVLSYDYIQSAYIFYGKQQEEYTVEVIKKDYFEQRRSIFLQGNSDVIIQFDLISQVQTTIKFRVYDLIQQDENNQIDNCKLEITKINTSNEEPFIGMTNDQGIFIYQGVMFNKIKVQASKKGFLNISYEFDVNANKAGEFYQIPMIPDYYSLINQYHILIYIPNSNNYQLDFNMICSDGIKLNTKNRVHQTMKSKLDVKKLNQNSMLYNFSLHISCLNPFVNNNQFQFIIGNQLNKRKSLNANNEKIIKENNIINYLADVAGQRIMNYAIEESIRIFITYGHLVIDTQVVSTNQLLQQEKCFGIIDLDKRHFVKENEIIQQTKKQQNIKKVNSSFDMTTILSQITNQQVNK
ncbi:unnamed protein product [Paramecium pentaurelia]|uniref:Uncharacterized protein n=1 Tax=Paramecium pentaurelia TaxID=43138 RepID=A0A8S1V1S1_9CILI|nr:unnamed protein product [Paramecium pentaurelia]